MKKFFYYWLPALFVIAAFGQEATAQVTFKNNTLTLPYRFLVGDGFFYGGNTTPKALTVPATPGLIDWTVYVYKPQSDINTQGYIEIYPGDDNGNISSTPISRSQKNVFWSVNPLQTQTYAALSDRCNVSTATVAGATKIYAVFFNYAGQKLATSPGIPLSFPPPVLCSGIGINICASQNVLYTTKPALLTGQDAPPSNKVFRWEYSYSGNDNDWHTIDGREERDFQPWDCWQTVYYRRVILWERTNIWGQKYRDFYANSNVVTIIPYVAVTPGVYKIRNRTSGQVLEIGGGGGASITDGTRANQWPSVGTANQEWNITDTSTGVYRIINRNSAEALEIRGAPLNLIQQGAGANQWPYWGGKNQHWLFQPVFGAQGYFTITNANSGQILEIGGGNPINAQAGARANQWPYSGEDFFEQQWELVPVSVPTSTRFPGVYTIRNVNSQKLLEIGGASTDSGATANQWSNAGTASQQWTFVETSNGFFKIINRNSGSVLRIGLLSNVANQGSSFTNSLNEQWDIFELAPGIFKITIRSDNTRALEIQGAYKFDGAAADVWPYWGGTNQQWILTRISQNRVAFPSADSISQQSKVAQPLAVGTGHLFEAEPKLSLYPNPASRMLNLSLSGKAKLILVKIRDMRGAVVSTIRYPTGNQVDISSLTAGVYLLTVSDGKGEYHQKFIKK